jgi:hypothetical protein
MSSLARLSRWGGARLSRRLARSVPYIGTVVALATLGATIRRKGTVGGLADTGLNSIPWVGAAKNLIEVLHGEDFFPDRAAQRARAGRTQRH